MNNSVCKADIADYDISIPTETKNWHILLDEVVCAENGRCGAWYVAEPKFETGYHLAYVDSNYDGGEDPDYNGRFLCDPTNSTGQKICANLATAFGSAGYYHLL